MSKILALALLLPSFLSADRPSCGDLCGYGKLEAGTGLIGFRPSICKIGYAITDPNPPSDLPQGKLRTLHPEYEMGLRASIGYGSRYGGCDARLEYTFLHSRHANQAGPPQSGTLWAILGHPRYLSEFAPLVNGEIAAKNRLKATFDYDAVDLQLATICEWKPCLSIRSYMGLHFLNLDHRLAQDLQGIVPTSPLGNNLRLFDFWCDKRSSWALGPLIGFDGTMRFHRALALTGHIGMALVSGEARWRRIEEVKIDDGNMILLNETLNVKRERCTHLTPYIRGSLGVAYCLWIPWAYQLIGELTYEFHSYLNGDGLFRFNDQRGTGSYQQKSFNLDGIALMVRLVV